MLATPYDVRVTRGGGEEEEMQGTIESCAGRGHFREIAAYRDSLHGDVSRSAFAKFREGSAYLWDAGMDERAKYRIFMGTLGGTQAMLIAFGITGSRVAALLFEV